MTRVKICGITRHEDAEHAVLAGAWALGFVLWPGSVRACDPAIAAGIARELRRRTNVVVVLKDPTLDEVSSAAELIDPAYIQLHGEQGPAFCAEVARRTGARVIKAVGVHSVQDIARADQYRNVDLHLLDAAVPGSGETWEWGMAARHASSVPIILSGGLTADNVAAGIAAVAPYVVDVASGVEASHGVKDPAKVEAFIAAARTEVEVA